jgi:hypothetical protein
MVFNFFFPFFYFYDKIRIINRNIFWEVTMATQPKCNKPLLSVLLLLTFTLAVSSLLVGCGAGRTMVLAPSETSERFSEAEITEGQSTVTVPSDMNAAFQSKLAQLIYGPGGFSQGPGLKLKYRFIQFNPGSQFTRWFWGGLGSAGKGTMTVEVTFLDPSGKELAKIQSEGEITSGAFGGPFDLAIQKAATEVAEYAKRFR